MPSNKPRMTAPAPLTFQLTETDNDGASARQWLVEPDRGHLGGSYGRADLLGAEEVRYAGLRRFTPARPSLRCLLYQDH